MKVDRDRSNILGSRYKSEISDINTYIKSYNPSLSEGNLLLKSPFVPVLNEGTINSS